MRIKPPYIETLDEHVWLSSAPEDLSSVHCQCTLLYPSRNQNFTSISQRKNAQVSHCVSVGSRSGEGKSARATRNRCPFDPTLSVEIFQVLGIEPPLPGYRVEDVQSEVLVNLKGLLVTMNGTVQQVYQQILEINPEYESEFGPVWNATAPTPDEIWRANFAAERRETWSDCGHWDPARAEAIWEGINHLNHVSGRPMSKPGPGVCGRVSCSYDSAIWWCNDVRIKIFPVYCRFISIYFGHPNQSFNCHVTHFWFDH